MSPKHLTVETCIYLSIHIHFNSDHFLDAAMHAVQTTKCSKKGAVSSCCGLVSITKSNMAVTLCTQHLQRRPIILRLASTVHLEPRQRSAADTLGLTDICLQRHNWAQALWLKYSVTCKHLIVPDHSCVHTSFVVSTVDYDSCMSHHLLKRWSSCMARACDVDYVQSARVLFLVCVSALTLTSTSVLTGQQCHGQSDDQQKGGQPLRQW